MTRNLNASMDHVIGDGACCRIDTRPNDGQLAYERILDLLVSDALEAAGFDQTVSVTQRDDVREMGLLGPDSPSDYVFAYRPVLRDGSPASLEAMRALAVEVYHWIAERAASSVPLRSIGPAKRRAA